MWWVILLITLSPQSSRLGCDNNFNFGTLSSQFGTFRVVGWRNSPQDIMAPTKRQSEATKISGRSVSLDSHYRARDSWSVNNWDLNQANQSSYQRGFEMNVENKDIISLNDKNVSLADTEVDHHKENIVKKGVALSQSVEIRSQRHLSVDNLNSDNLKDINEECHVRQETIRLKI